MQQRHVSFDETEQLHCLKDYMAVRWEIFLDFDPVPYPDPLEESALPDDNGCHSGNVPRA